MVILTVRVNGHTWILNKQVNVSHYHMQKFHGRFMRDMKEKGFDPSKISFTWSKEVNPPWSYMEIESHLATVIRGSNTDAP